MSSNTAFYAFLTTQMSRPLLLNFRRFWSFYLSIFLPLSLYWSSVALQLVVTRRSCPDIPLRFFFAVAQFLFLSIYRDRSLVPSSYPFPSFLVIFIQIQSISINNQVKMASTLKPIYRQPLPRSLLLNNCRRSSQHSRFMQPQRKCALQINTHSL